MKLLHNLVNTATYKAMENDRFIREVISQVVPATMLSHIQFCRIEGGRMRMTVDNAAWISKLRFNERQIIDAIRKTHLDVVTVSFHVAPAEMPVARTTVRTANRSVNQATSEALRRLAYQSNNQQDDVNADQCDNDNRPPSLPGKTPPSSNLTSGERGQYTMRKSVVRNADDRFRRELLKLAEKLKTES